jgi:hypothetical protein
MRRRADVAWSAGACLAACLAFGNGADGAEIVVSINKATQSMSVLIDEIEQHHWTISTGIGGGPPTGQFRPGRMERKWFSRKYNRAPMPYSIFFEGNYAIHGTIKISQLGRRASKGCVRLHPDNAAILFGLVLRHGVSKTTIVISNTTHVAAKAAPAPQVETPQVEAPWNEAKTEPSRAEDLGMEQ